MNNEKVINLPASTNYTPRQALLSALDMCKEDGTGLSDVMVIGYDWEGYLFVRSSKMTRAEGLFMVEKAREWSMRGGLE
jgi:hypothetical protein